MFIVLKMEGFFLYNFYVIRTKENKGITVKWFLFLLDRGKILPGKGGQLIMREMDFTTEDLTCCKVGDRLKIIEYHLPTSYWYMIEHALGASANYKNRERLVNREGKVVKLWQDERFKYIRLAFDE